MRVRDQERVFRAIREFERGQAAVEISPHFRAGGDVADVALDNLVRFDPVNIAHEFNLNLLPISPPQRKIFVTDIFILLECFKGRTIAGRF